MTSSSLKLFGGIKDDNIVIFDTVKPLCLIDKLNIFGVSFNGNQITIKLPYSTLIFTPSESNEFVGNVKFHPYLLTIDEFKTKINSIQHQSSLSCDFIQNTESKYRDLSERSLNSTTVFFSSFVDNNLDFNLKLIALKYNVGIFNYTYQLLTHSKLEITDYKIESDSPFFVETSISLCSQNVEGIKCVLICSSHLFVLPPEKQNKFDTKTVSLTKNILTRFSDNNFSNNIIWFYSTNDCSAKRDNTDNMLINFLSIDLGLFSVVLTILDSPKKTYESYFTYDFCIKILQWFIVSFKCSQYLSKGCNVVIEDTDSTPVSFIIGSLSKIMTDPKYCTFDGFIGLIRDDWINRGYFYILGNDTTVKEDKEKLLKERLNYFYAWLSCVQFLLYKYPLVFEFNYWMIFYITNNLWTHRFYPFNYNCPDGDIFKRLIENKKNLINYGYYLNKLPQIYSALVEEIKTGRNFQKNQYEYRLQTIFNGISPQFHYETQNIDFDNYYSLKLNTGDLFLLKTGEIFKFIFSSFYDPDAGVFNKLINPADSVNADNSDDGDNKSSKKSKDEGNKASGNKDNPYKA